MIKQITDFSSYEDFIESIESNSEFRDPMLLVETDNVPAINLYKKAGFTPVSGSESVTIHLKP